MKESTVDAAMTIILNAGDARVECKLALDAIAEGDIEKAEEKMKEANKKIQIAHKAQTDAIQAEASGEESEYSVLFAHAQDTLMTIYSELNIAKQLIKIFKVYEQRISALEKFNEK